MTLTFVIRRSTRLLPPARRLDSPRHLPHFPLLIISVNSNVVRTSIYCCVDDGLTTTTAAADVMATLREFQIALQDKLEEIVQRDELIEELEREIAEKDRKIESLTLELGKYRSLVSNTTGLNSPTQKLTPSVHITRPPVVLQQATKVESPPTVTPVSAIASLSQFPPAAALLGIKEKRNGISGEPSSSSSTSMSSTSTIAPLATSHHPKNQK